jgi:hypothetical protein
LAVSEVGLTGPTEAAIRDYTLGSTRTHRPGMGLRWSEVAGLRVSKVDFLRRTVEVSETLAEVESKLIERSQTAGQRWWR